MNNIWSRRIAIGIISLTAFMVLGLGLARVLRPKKNFVEIDRADYPVLGVDLSAHNGTPDFDSLANIVDFVYLKASEGVAFRDPRFETSYSDARRRKIRTGAYHFFRFDCDGRRQAINFLAAIDGRPLDLPPAIDIEESGNPAEVPTEIISERLQTMIELMRAAGYQPLIYTNKKGHSRFVRGKFGPEELPELWICSFTNPPVAHTGWTFWQHSHCGRLPGVKGLVDLNTFNGTRAEWNSRFPLAKH